MATKLWWSGEYDMAAFTLVGTVSCETRLEEDLQDSVQHAHPPAHEGEEGHHELDEVIAESLEAMKPPRRVMHVVGHGVRHRLGLTETTPITRV